MLVAVAVCSPMFGEGTLPLDTSALLNSAPWRNLETEPVVSDLDSYASAESLVRYSDYAVISRAIESGESLLWSPLEYGGTPFMARWETGTLSPFSLPLRVFPLDRALQVSALLKLLVAALCMYIAARGLGLFAPMALVAAVTWSASGGLLLWLGHPVSDVTPWLPMFVLAIDRILDGRLRSWPLASITGALMLLGGDPIAAEAAMGACLLYFLVRLSLWRAAPRRFLSLGTVAISIVIAHLVAGAQILPWLDYRAWVQPGREFAINIPHASELIRSFFAPLASVSTSSIGDLLPREKTLFTVGTVSTLMTVLWLTVRVHVTRAHRSRVDAMLVAAALVFGLAAIPAALQAARGSTPLGYHQVLPFVSLAFGLIAAFAMQAWIELDPPQCSAALRRLALLVPAYLAGFAILVASDGLLGPEASQLDTTGLAIEFGLLMSGLLLLGVTLFRPSMPVAGYGLAALAAVSVLAMTPGLMTFGKSPTDSGTGFVDHLATSGTSVSGSDALTSWPLAVAGIRQSHGTASRPSKAVHAWLDRAGDDATELRERLLLTSDDLQTTFGNVRPALTLLAAYPQGTALFDQPAAPGRVMFAGLQAGNEAHSARILTDSNTLVSVATRVSEPSILVMLDSYHDGWTATINGEPVEIESWLNAFRAVAIPPGSHTVTFRFAPAYVRTGLFCSGGGILLILAGTLFAFVRSRRIEDE